MNQKDTVFNYNGQPVYIGIDVHKKTWTVSICTEHTQPNRWPVKLQAPFVENLVAHLDKHYPGGTYYAAYEAGFSGFWAQRQLESAGIDTLVLNAADIPVTHKDVDQKTDNRDSRKIARTIRTGDVSSIYIPSKQAVLDRSVVRTRFQMAKNERRFKCMIKSHLNFMGYRVPEHLDHRHWPNRFIQWLMNLQKEKQDPSLSILLEGLQHMRKLCLQSVKELRKLAQSDRYAEVYQNLRSIPGIGLKNGMLIITEIVDMNRFRNINQLYSYCGLIPSQSSSGENEQMRELTNRTNKRLRSALVECSWAAVRHHPVMRCRYEQYCKRMIGPQAIIRIARKLVSQIRYVWLHDVQYKSL